MLHESAVKAYCRSFPKTFVNAFGSYIFDEKGHRYLDFLSGCGSLNYGHNHPFLKQQLLSYIQDNGISMSLDIATASKFAFLEALDTCILQPRKLRYTAQFPGPTGTNAVEAAIKLARKYTGRTNVISFTNAFHGCTLGSLALTANSHHRSSSAQLLTHVTRMPYDGYFGQSFDTSVMLEDLLGDPSSGVDLPAAIIVETIQGEGGLNTASHNWLQSISKIARQYEILLILDEIQTGCGRSGTFFSFEYAEIEPDLIVMAKSLSGYGLPFSLVLLKPELDIWEPGEHNGTFRGNNLAFVTATAALTHFWMDNAFIKDVNRKEKLAKAFLQELGADAGAELRGRGMMIGLKFSDKHMAETLRRRCFQSGLVLECCGPRDEVLKFLPPLTASDDELETGFKILSNALKQQTDIPSVIDTPISQSEEARVSPF